MSSRLDNSEGNPFPGLRPFKEEEEYLFFGRETQVDSMVNKLGANRFLAVVGGSGSGKSSLVNCGLRPALHRGLLTSAGTSWRMAQFRPGSDPLEGMANALAQKNVLFPETQTEGMSLKDIIETTLRMSKLGLVDIYQQARLPEHVNLLVIVDQFEELFRYSQLRDSEEGEGGVSALDEAKAFVNILLEATKQAEHPIYVAITMRSDFLGDCAQFSGLPEAINTGQYLVPRMTREERKQAITGPILVGGGDIDPVLLTRLVNDVGDNPDQLSILQHALNRTWAKWQQDGVMNIPLSLEHYQAIGTMAHALDQHAERAYSELDTEEKKQICEKLFKAITDKGTDARGTRRPTKFGKLCELIGSSEDLLKEVIDVFRDPSRSFLMPPISDAIERQSVIDISHESLMRVWSRLKRWVEEEAESARLYRRLADTALLHNQGKADFLGRAELAVAHDWFDRNQPNKAWAVGYHPDFDLALQFLRESQEKYDEEEQKKREQHQKELEQAKRFAEEQKQRAEAERQRAQEKAKLTKVLFGGVVITLVFLIVAIFLGVSAYRAKNKADADRVKAENSERAKNAALKMADERRKEALNAKDDAENSRDAAKKAKEKAVKSKKEMFSHQLIFGARSNLSIDPELSILLALEARERTKSFEPGAPIRVKAIDELRKAVHASQLRKTLFGHKSGAKGVAFSQDGKYLASVGVDKSLKVWDISHGDPKMLYEFNEESGGHTNSVNAVAFSKDGKYVVTASSDKTAKIWDIVTQTLKHTLKGHKKSVNAVTFSNDGKNVLTASSDHTSIFWSVETGKERLKYEEHGGSHIQFSNEPQ